MKIDKFTSILNADFYTGVPDSQLKALCDYLMKKYGIDPRHHIIAANEGNATALAAGYYLATRKTAVVYMQNSGEGNIINPTASLLNDHVYAIPVIFVIGWRGEPGIHDEPQHVYQGEITLKLLENMDIQFYVVDKNTTIEMLSEAMNNFRPLLFSGKQVAFIIRKGALEFDDKVIYKNDHTLTREEAIKHIINISDDDPIISTTGKASRELFEARTENGEGHSNDFLTVGSMGHCSSIALEIAIQRPDAKLWCIDGDGAVLMHMGSLAIIGSISPSNLVHIVINNGAHETVGGMPTVARDINLVELAKACGYPYAISVDNTDNLDKELKEAKIRNTLSFIEIKCALGSRDDLGRPTSTTFENKELFMNKLGELEH